MFCCKSTIFCKRLAFVSSVTSSSIFLPASVLDVQNKNTYNQIVFLYSIKLKVSWWSCSVSRETSNHILWDRTIRNYV
jgi:hypothetical protein